MNLRSYTSAKRSSLLADSLLVPVCIGGYQFNSIQFDSNKLSSKINFLTA